MTRTRWTLDDLGEGLSERALLSFMKHLPPESATMHAVEPDMGGWSRTDMLLARICEAIEQLLWVEVSKSTKKSRRPKMPERIQRPGVASEKKKVGRDGIPIEDFDLWYGGEA